jgi:hypothetical protein
MKSKTFALGLLLILSMPVYICSPPIPFCPCSIILLYYNPNLLFYKYILRSPMYFYADPHRLSDTLDSSYPKYSNACFLWGIEQSTANPPSDRERPKTPGPQSWLDKASRQAAVVLELVV